MKNQLLQFDSNRIDRVIEHLTRYASMDFSRKLPISESGDELDAVAAALNTLAEELEAKSLSVKNNEARVNEIMEALLSYTMMDFSRKLRVSDLGDEWDAISLGLNTLTEELEYALDNEKISRENLEKAYKSLSDKNEILSGIAEINQTIRGQDNVNKLSTNLIKKICESVGASVGAIYVSNDENVLRFSGGYAFDKDPGFQILMGQGLVGQAAVEKNIKLVKDIPSDYIKITSALGNMSPRHLLIIPFIFEERTIAIAEIGLLSLLTPIQEEYLKQISENVAVAFNSVISREKLEELYIQTQQQAEELEAQQEELKQTNEELSNQAQMLLASEEELNVQQEELKQANYELEEKANELIKKNIELEDAKQAIITKAREIEKASRYKSEFLANMSHELRTPLNSILILAKLLEENTEANLTPKQIECANVIYQSGDDLLHLLNDILDLSKIESGKLELMIQPVFLKEIAAYIRSLFYEAANNKKIKLIIKVAKDLSSEEIRTDRGRLEQILKNLVSNALKFTEEGSVTLTIKAVPAMDFQKESLKNSKKVILFSIADTGIGIPENKLSLIFEAFQQADGSTSRRYGGTGLGLSISKQLAEMLGGEIHVRSKVNKGSTFNLFIPAESSEEIKSFLPETVNGKVHVEQKQVSKPIIQKPAFKNNGKKHILIIEDDKRHNHAISQLILQHLKQAVCFSAYTGVQAFSYLENTHFDCIILDLRLHDISGFEIIERLRSDSRYSSVPIIVHTGQEISPAEEKIIRKHDATVVLKHGASDKRLMDEILLTLHIIKDQKAAPSKISAKLRESFGLENILIVDDDIRNLFSLTAALEKYGFNIMQASNGIEALQCVKEKNVDLILMDIMMPEMDGYDTIREIRKSKVHNKLPIIALTAKTMAQDRQKVIEAGASDYISKPVNIMQLLSLMRVWLYKEN